MTDQAEQRVDQPAPRDRAEEAGYPPDSGPEQEVLVVSPSLVRGHPLSVLILTLLPFAAVAGLIYFATGWRTPVIGSAIAMAVCWGGIFFWWLVYAKARTLEITNKRTIEHRGLLSRSRDEVLHDHVRNIQIDQSFFERIMGVGTAGQSGVEIEMKGLPGPDKIRSVIDLYRPL